jgi:hypothetical protein
MGSANRNEPVDEGTAEVRDFAGEAMVTGRLPVTLRIIRW